MGKHQESTDDSQVLQELGHLHLSAVTGPTHVKHESSEDSESDEHPGCGRGAFVDEEHEATSELEDNSNNRGQCGHAGHSPGSETHSDVLTGAGKVHEEPGATDYKEQSEKHSGEMSLCHTATFIAHHKYDVKKLRSSPVYQKKRVVFGGRQAIFWRGTFIWYTRET